MAEAFTLESLEQFKNMGIRDVDPATVVDIETIRIDINLPVEQRLLDMLRQMNGNPYFYRCGGILVKTSFTGEVPLQRIVEDYLEHSR